MEDKEKKLVFYEPSSSDEEDNVALPGNLGLEYKSEIKSVSSVLHTPPDKNLQNKNLQKRPILSCFEVRNISLDFIPSFEISSRVNTYT